MRYIRFVAVAATLLASSSFSSAAEQFGTAAEAQAMVKNAIVHMKKVGREQAYADFTAKKPPFVDRDLYVTVTSTAGISMAHGQNLKMVGVDLMEMRDVDGKAYFKERMELAKTKSSFWHDLKFVDPISKKVLPKSMYCERDTDVVVCTGIYKR